jgi:hypothetical protein
LAQTTTRREGLEKMGFHEGWTQVTEQLGERAAGCDEARV